MKTSLILSLSIFALLLFAPAAIAADFGVRAGRFNDAGDNFVGADLELGLGPVRLIPNIEYVLTDNSDDTVLLGSVDLTYEFGRSAIKPYVGAGLGALYTDSDFGDNTESLFNVVGGLKWDLSFIKPYAQVKYFKLFDSSDADDIALTVGIRF